MANLNPAGVIRDLSNDPTHARQIHEIVGRINGGGAHAITIETQLTTLLGIIVFNETDHVMLTPTESASTAHAGSRKVAFTVANSKEYTYVIWGYCGRSCTVDTTSGTTTITYNPVTQK